MPVGKMVLNHNPSNFFAEVEQAAFCPASIVPGIEFSADKLLQGRTFAYADTQRHRLGPNYLQLPINRPIVSVDNYQRDGSMQFGSFNGSVNYDPNSLAGGMPKEALVGIPYAYRIAGKVTRRKIRKTNDFEQAGEKYRSLSKRDREHLVDNLITDLMHINKPIQRRVIKRLAKADSDLGRSVAKGLKL
jgi:catalase